MRISFVLFLIICSCFFSTAVSAKTPQKIRLLFEDRIIDLDFKIYPNLLVSQPVKYLLLGEQKILLNSSDLSAENDLLEIDTSFKTVVSKNELRIFLEDAGLIRSLDAKPVEVNMDLKTKKISFVGNPSLEYLLDFDVLVSLIDHALLHDVTTIRVPAQKQYSKLVVHPDLKLKGITEVVSIGESNFRGSSYARRKNIAAAAKIMNGILIKPGEVFSFNKRLGSVDESLGFVKELVIKGDKTIPELGGGVCQVSTTLFRSAFYGGFPIIRRRAHSYSVPYYRPVGLDAAIYLGQLDFQFKNDTDKHLLIQSVVDGNSLNFVLYGTSPGRKVFAKGPFISGWSPEPETEYTETNDLPAGEKVVDKGGHAGFTAVWKRIIEQGGQKKTENFQSIYRPWAAKGRIGAGAAEEVDLVLKTPEQPLYEAPKE